LLVLYGASATGDANMNALVWLTAAAAASFILLVNAFHGSLRDIEVELVCHQRTTPIWLGCLGVREGKVHISKAMSMYAGACQLTLLLLSLALARHESWQRNPGPVIATGIVVVANAGLFFLLHRVRKPAWDVLMRVHVTILALPVLLAFIPRLGSTSATVLFLLYFTPTLLTAYYWLHYTRGGAAPRSVPADRKGDVTRTGPQARFFRSRP
jgi:hypothetical protein